MLITVVALAFVIVLVLLVLVAKPDDFKISAAILKLITFSVEIRRTRARD